MGVTLVDVPPPIPLVPPKNMATIQSKKKADGTMSYTVQIRLKKKGVIVYQEAQTFARKQAAQAWAKRRETEFLIPIPNAVFIEFSNNDPVIFQIGVTASP